jgi:hypothetical protein
MARKPRPQRELDASQYGSESNDFLGSPILQEQKKSVYGSDDTDHVDLKLSKRFTEAGISNLNGKTCIISEIFV